MTRRIRQLPTLSHLTLERAAGPAIHPLEAPGRSLWYSGSIAIWQGVHALGLKEGDRILVPAYCCGSEIDVLIKARLNLAYYHIHPDLSPNLDHLSQLCAEPARALFFIHYFGVPQPLDQLIAFADEHGLLVIEDNAHGLSSFDDAGQPLGSRGDICIFSFTKTLAIPDGGALMFGQRATAKPDALASERPGFRTTAGKLANIMRATLSDSVPIAGNAVRWARRRGASAVGRAAGQDKLPARKPVDDDLDYYLFNTAKRSWRMSSLSRNLLLHTNHNAIRAIRRRNFTRLSEAFEGGKYARPLVAHLPAGCSPMMYPVWAEDPDSLLDHLRKAGVETNIFWLFTHAAAPRASFEFERDLKRRCVEIPVHQCLDEDDMAVIANALNSWNAKRG